mmetsp:Transcript_8992/g.13129  ORF Transcript_8992/g.13129 Transcript_8992/m.13129 type:complete len:202 (-) Transcript_8992:528-1133(-)
MSILGRCFASTRVTDRVPCLGAGRISSTGVPSADFFFSLLMHIERTESTSYPRRQTQLLLPSNFEPAIMEPQILLLPRKHSPSAYTNPFLQTQLFSPLKTVLGPNHSWHSSLLAVTQVPLVSGTEPVLHAHELFDFSNCASSPYMDWHAESVPSTHVPFTLEMVPFLHWQLLIPSNSACSPNCEVHTSLLPCMHVPLTSAV